MFEQRTATEGQRIGLALSGGGFRASLFHIGVLARLAELDLLRQVDVLSCVSGGSIIGALYYLYLKRELDARGEVDTLRLTQIIAEMEQHFLAVLQKNLRWQAFANLGSNFRLARSDYSRTDRFGDLLDRHLYRPIFGGDPARPVEMRMLNIYPRGQRDFNPITDNAHRLCKVPTLLINATTLNTGHSWRFGTDRMGELRRSNAARQVDKNWLLCSSRYGGLAPRYAEMPLGQAVAASAAVPGVFEAFPLSRLYPHPDRTKRHLQTLLVDGGVHDNLGVEGLQERGCTHFIVSDASGQLADDPAPDTRFGATVSRCRDILMDRIRELQLARLADRYPQQVVVLHLMREMAAPEFKPIGPADNGHIIRDRADNEVTSFGVQRRVQRQLAGIRTDLDAFSDIEATALMADGYLITQRAFDEQAQQKMAWTDMPPLTGTTWRFAPLFDVLRAPSAVFIRRLDVARHRFFKGQRLVPRLRFEAALLCLTTIMVSLAMVGLPSLLGTDMPSLPLALVQLGVILALMAFPAFQWLKMMAKSAKAWSWLGPPLTVIGAVSVITAALPLTIIARLHLYAGRLFLREGTLTKIGLEPITSRRHQDAPASVPEPQPTESKKAA